MPPIALSTWATRVVGTCQRGSPRANVAATKPARSPTTPPPTATMCVLRSTASSARPVHNRAAEVTPFDDSPEGTSSAVVTTPAAVSEPATRAACDRATAASAITTALRPPAAATRPPTESISPLPQAIS